MKQLALKGQGGEIFTFNAENLMSVEALNHDDSVRCEMHLYALDVGYVCQRVERPGTIDSRYRLAVCEDIMSVYQFFGTEPLANFLYGSVGFAVPGMRQKVNVDSN